jgi:hypothetical protein
MYIDFATGYKFPPYWLTHPEVIKKIDSTTKMTEGLLNVNCSCPLSIKLSSESEYWQLPIEPVVNVSGKNTIVKRNVLKAGISDTLRRGSVKELWTQDDYQVNIAGVIIGDKNNELPSEALMRLRNMCEARQVLNVMSPLFSIFNIKNIAIEDYEFPFTKGMANQMFSIKAVSDDYTAADLIVEGD